MADRVLFVSWGDSVRGREEHGLEVFNEAVGMYGRMQQDGRIESFDVVLFDPNGGMNGYMELRGTAAQMEAVRQDADFRRLLADAGLIVDGLRLIGGVCNEGIAQDMAMYQEAISQVPQQA
jgi:hypothetical protein